MPPTIALIWVAFGLFVLGCTVLFCVLLLRHLRHDAAAMVALQESRDEIRRVNADLERRVAERTRQLEAADRELESFAYAVSHDLRAPLRSMSGFSQILQESAPAGLDEKSRHYLQRIHESSQRMSSLIEDLLGLSRIGRSELAVQQISLSRLCNDTATAVRARHAGREVELEIADDMQVSGDARLLRIAMENLLGNAWKYTGRAAHARIAVGVQPGESGPVYFVRDNGVGFDMAYSNKLFTPFQRLHPESDFSGNGIGLVTVQRILARHGGRIWAEAAPNQGATFYFTLPRSEETGD